MSIICVTILLLASIQALNARHPHNPKIPKFLFGRPPGGFLNPAYAADKEEVDDSVLKKFTVTQPIDHANPTMGTYEQRVQYNPTYYKNNSLIFLMIGGESEAADKWAVNDYTYIRWAKKYGAAVFQLEHRFFGQSRPFGNNISTEALKYLTISQAIDDVVSFIAQMNKKYGYINPRWVTFGGSYPATMNAWMRAKYPSVTVGAVASSAPIDITLDCFPYTMVVENVLKNTSEDCVTNMRNLFTGIIQKSLTAGGRAELSDKLKLDPKFDETTLTYLDIQNLIANLNGLISNVVQYTYDGRAYENMHGLDVRTMCAQMNSSTVMQDPTAQMRAIIDWSNALYNESAGQPYGNSYSDTVKELAKNTYDDPSAAEYRGWLWLCCNEIGAMVTTDEGRNVFGSALPLNYFIDMCTDIFGSSVNIRTIRDNNERAKKTWAGPDTYNATNIVLPNGAYDPWSATGTYNTKPAQHLIPILIPEAAHCADMYPPWSGESKYLEAARQTIEKELQYFIGYVPS